MAYTAIYPLSLHDALPIYLGTGESLLVAKNHAGGIFFEPAGADKAAADAALFRAGDRVFLRVDRKSTRLNSSHTVISYAVFCLKKKTDNAGAHRPCPASAL